MWILYCILAIVAIFVVVILIRTIMFKPTAQPQIFDDEVKFDNSESISALSQLIRCKTVSYYDPSLEDNAEFEKLITLLT